MRRRSLVGLLLAAPLLAALPPAGPRRAVAAAPRMLRWGYVVTYDPASLASLQANAGRLDFVSPGFFGLDAGGAVTGGDEPAIREAARRGGARLVPMVQNKATYADFAPVLGQPELRARAVAALVGLVDRYGYAGLHLDFEALRPEERDALTGFVAELAAALRPRGKLTTIAVPSRVSDAAGVWSAPYDFAALGQLADYVVVMAYAFRTAGSARPGSISPADQVELTAAYAARQVPPARLLLGVGLWGYDWDVLAGGRAATRKYPETQELARRYGGVAGYSQLRQSAWLRYEDADSPREVWYEDRRSVRAKLAIAARHELAGVAAWRLGQEDPGVWSLFTPEYPAPPAPATPTADHEVPGGRFYSQTGGGSGRGYRVVDEGRDAAGRPIRFWSEFRRLGGVDVLGYPASRRYVGADGFTYQAFQRALLQWRPERGVAYLANVFEQLSAAGRDPALASRGIPPPIADDGSGGDWARARRTRLGWLTEPAIAARFRASPSPAAGPWSEDAAIQLHGLPASRPVRSGPFVVQRFQRLSLQLWVEDVPGMPPRGSVVGILGGDLLKEQGLIPGVAAEPEAPEA